MAGYRYYVTFRPTGGLMDGTEVVVGHMLDNAIGRAEAKNILAERGVDRPQITGWALRDTGPATGEVNAT